ncbi:glycosyltransferase family 2 protein [Prochlorococcus sp. AH-716-O13]|nr:glycosyltransferase family 2 protein [Prochlorococcus sp. AH-716-O13]
MRDNENQLISIVIPCFNSGNILKRAIDSVFDQTWKDFEIVLVNDGSNDKSTLRIFDLFKRRPAFRLINQNNLGLPAARNAGARNAKGKYLFFLDADDWIEPASLELMFSHIRENEDKVFIFSDIKLEGESHNLVRKEYNFFEQLFINQVPYSIFISKKNWSMAGGYDEIMRDGYEDWEFNIRLGAAGIYGKRLAKTLFHYNVSNSGMLLSRSSKLHAKIWNYILKKNNKLFEISQMLKIWFKWRNKPSSYPLVFFFGWFFLLKLLPEPLVSKLFIKLRNLKWFFTRNNIFNIK